METRSEQILMNLESRHANPHRKCAVEFKKWCDEENPMAGEETSEVFTIYNERKEK